MAFDPVTGNFPALWMRPIHTLGNSSAYGGELDIFEWQSQQPTTFVGGAHVWVNGTDVGNTNSNNSWSLPGGANLANYNTYGVLWTPTSISWYFNNILMGTLDTTVAPFNTVFRGQESYFLILGEQAGCNWSQVCPGQVSPINMRVQWVRVFQPSTQPSSAF
jgi:beta-glucanase (GH16 family)